MKGTRREKRGDPRARAEPCGRRDRKENEGEGLPLANKQTRAHKHAHIHTHTYMYVWFSLYLPSNSAGPTPTIIIDMGRDAACEGWREPE